MIFIVIFMTALDILIIVLAIVAIVMGFRSGLLRQAGRLLGVIAGIIACRIFAQDVAIWMGADKGSPYDSADVSMLTTVVAYVVVFIVAYVAMSLLGSLLKRIVSATGLGPVDRVCGAVFNLAEYALVLSLVLNLWIVVFPDSSLRHDRVATYRLGSTGLSLLNFAPKVLGSEAVGRMLDVPATGAQEKPKVQEKR